MTTQNLERIYGYHRFHEPIKFHSTTPTEDKRGLFIGMELEVDGFPTYTAIEQCADTLNRMNHGSIKFHNEHDGSLRMGFEIVTMPTTLNYMRFHFPMEKVLATVTKHGGKSHDTGTCGLHFHVSRNWFGKKEEICTLKILYLFEKFYPELLKFSRREPAQLHFCQRYGDRDFAQMKTRREIHAKLESCRGRGRYRTVNLCNERTIEFRIFRGTLKYDTLIASAELIDFICRMVKVTSIEELEAMNWQGFVEKIRSYKKMRSTEYRYATLLNYIAERGLDRDRDSLGAQIERAASSEVRRAAIEALDAELHEEEARIIRELDREEEARVNAS